MYKNDHKFDPKRIGDRQNIDNGLNETNNENGDNHFPF